MATPLIAKELQASFRLAIAEAKRMRHEYLTLEHLLLALLKDAKTRQVLSSCGANLPRLQKRLEQFLEETVERLPAGVEAEPQQTMAVDRSSIRSMLTPPTSTWKPSKGTSIR